MHIQTRGSGSRLASTMTAASDAELQKMTMITV